MSRQFNDWYFALTDEELFEFELQDWGSTQGLLEQQQQELGEEPRGSSCAPI